MWDMKSKWMIFMLVPAGISCPRKRVALFRQKKPAVQSQGCLICGSLTMRNIFLKDGVDYKQGQR